MSYSTSTSAQFVLPVGQTATALITTSAGAASINVVGASGVPALDSLLTTTKVYGPYPEAKTVTIVASAGVAVYDYGVSPANPPFMYSPTPVPLVSVQSPTTGASTVPPASLSALANSGVGAGRIAVLNANASNTKVLRQILNYAGGGRGRGRIWHIGSSIEAGAGALGGTLYGSSGGKSLARPAQSARLLAARGMRANAYYWVCDSGAGTVTQAFDGNITQTGTAAGIFLTVSTMGGFPPAIAVGSTITYTLPAGVTCDTAEIAYFKIVNAGGQFGVGVDGGTTQLQSFTTTGAASINFVTVPVTAGSNAVTLKNTGSTAFFPVMIGLRNSAAPGIEVINAGFGGSGVDTSSAGGVARNWNADSDGNPYGCVSSVLAIPQTVPNVFHMEAIMNDFAIPLTTYIAGQTAWINRVKSIGGEVYWRIPFPPQDGVNGFTLAGYNIRADAARDNAIALGCVVIDERLIINDWAIANSLGLMFDNLHPNGGGYFTSSRTLGSLYDSLI